MLQILLGGDSPIPKFIYLKIRRRDGVESLTNLEEGEFKVPIDGCIRFFEMGFQRVLGLGTWGKGSLESLII